MPGNGDIGRLPSLRLIRTGRDKEVLPGTRPLDGECPHDKGLRPRRRLKRECGRRNNPSVQVDRFRGRRLDESVRPGGERIDAHQQRVQVVDSILPGIIRQRDNRALAKPAVLPVVRKAVPIRVLMRVSRVRMRIGRVGIAVAIGITHKGVRMQPHFLAVGNTVPVRIGEARIRPIVEDLLFSR